MSLANVLTYARARMAALGYTEHKDALNTENVPAQAFGRAFHVQMQESRGILASQDVQILEVDFAVRVFLKGKADTIAAHNDATARLDALLADLLKIGNRLTATGLLDVSFRNSGIDPVAGSNDNALIVRAEFTARTAISTR